MVDLSTLNEQPVTWPTDLPQLKNLDDRLRCPICYEHMKNPVISTGCTHSFCSLCIRNYIVIKNSCPICFGDINDGMLRSYRCMEEIIKCFLAIKVYLLEKLTHGVQPAKTPEPVIQNSEPSPSTSASPIIGSQNKVRRETRSKTAKEALTKIKQPPPSRLPTESRRVEKELFQSPLKVAPQAKTNTVAPASQPSNEVQCPVCQASMRESLINSHLDSCLSKKQEKRKPMPKLIYNLMKDAELKKRLRELGLSATGDRNTLVNRHKKYTILYNSECDSANPRPVIELRAQLEREEAESRRLAQAEPRLTSPRVKKTDPETIEKENQQYVQNNKDSFEQLIRDVKQRQQQLRAAAKEHARAQQNRNEQLDAAAPSTSAEPKETVDSARDLIAQPQEIIESVPESTLKPELLESPREAAGNELPSNDDDEITVLPTPVKVYETVSLVDSDEEAPSASRALTSILSVKRRVLSESEKSSHVTSEDSHSTFPDPMASSCKSTPKWTDASNDAWSPSITSDCDDNDVARSTRTPNSPSYSPLDDQSPDLFRQESSSSADSTPASRQRASKRNKSQMDGSSEKRKSSRRRI